MAVPPAGSPPADPAAVRRMIMGLWTTRALYVAAELGIPDLLAAGPQPCEALATSCQANASALYRVMRILAGMGLVVETDPGHFALAPLGQFLRSDVPGSQRALARMLGAPWHWRTFEGVLSSVRTGQPALDGMGGQPLWAFLAEHPDQEQIFDHAMTSFSSVEHDAIREAWDFTTTGTLVDVGGGRGHLLATLLREHPGLRGVLFDRPSVVATKKDAIHDMGLDARCERAGGDFFESVPSGGDAYLIKYVLHNWNDERVDTLLRTCRRAMKPSARLLLVEQIVQPGNSPDPVKLLDLEMLVLVGGRERTEEEFRRMLAAAGFSLLRVVPTRVPLSILEAAPV